MFAGVSVAQGRLVVNGARLQAFIQVAGPSISTLRVTARMYAFGSLTLLPAGLPDVLKAPGAFLTLQVGAAPSL
jgi:hypothetical protein